MKLARIEQDERHNVIGLQDYLARADRVTWDDEAAPTPAKMDRSALLLRWLVLVLVVGAWVMIWRLAR